MYNGLLHAHSGLRWILLLLLIASTIIAIVRWRSSASTYSKGLFGATTGLAHLQLIIGIVLLFISPKNIMQNWKDNDILRFYAMEHSTMMIIAVILITIGTARARRISSVAGKYKNISIFYGIALLIILAMIPWPFRIPTAGWF